ncbi:uncharacterized protein LOC123314850 [Coccinella septempunctata]|uniref:uncharacterized protein LOC123314850 n=1 Tax=Coccinella septempunctata TaxID=41139 RepID=UPI001D06889B|nr:uncharacterized protein LOC123314850 [Coccinella septempunctata]
MFEYRLLVLLLCLRMSESTICKKHIQNSLFPNYAAVPTYDIREWVVNLNLQRCTIVEVGEYYSAMFLEDENADSRFSFYLGMCDHETMRNWQFCSSELAMQRKNECSLDIERTEFSRVHRRFCDIHYITLTQKTCNCSTMLDTPLYRVNGFPTCFVDPLPESLCGPLNACGLHKCNATTVLGRIHSVQCDPNCKGQQPFCEWPVGLKTAQPPMVYSLWSDWYELEKRDDRTLDSQVLYYEAKCVNKYTYKGGIDCLGPGTSCCPPDILQCKCKTFFEDATLKVRRWVVLPIEHSTFKPRDYDVADDIVKHNTGIMIPKRNKKIPFASKREARFYEDDDEDEDDLGDEDVAIEEERMTRKMHLDQAEQQEENDEAVSPEAAELTGDSTIKDGKIVPNKRNSNSVLLRIRLNYFLLMISLYWIL